MKLNSGLIGAVVICFFIIGVPTKSEKQSTACGWYIKVVRTIKYHDEKGLCEDPAFVAGCTGTCTSRNSVMKEDWFTEGGAVASKLTYLPECRRCAPNYSNSTNIHDFPLAYNCSKGGEIKQYIKELTFKVPHCSCKLCTP